MLLATIVFDWIAKNKINDIRYLFTVIIVVNVNEAKIRFQNPGCG